MICREIILVNYLYAADDGPPIPEGISTEMKMFLARCFQKDVSKRADATELLQHEWIRKTVKVHNAISCSYCPLLTFIELLLAWR